MVSGTTAEHLPPKVAGVIRRQLRALTLSVIEKRRRAIALTHFFCLAALLEVSDKQKICEGAALLLGEV